MDDGRPRHLILVGLMGAGKTAVGRECARMLERTLIDTDDLVEATARRTVAEIFATEGEQAFRRLERVAVADACATPHPAVIACGGGVVLDEDNRADMRASGHVVWLTAPAEVLAARVGRGEGRPLLGGVPVESALDRLTAVRAPSYLAAADDTVATEGRSAVEVAQAVVASLGSAGGGPA